jgi:general secretion pathway protein B
VSYILDALKKSEQEREERPSARMPAKKGLVTDTPSVDGATDKGSITPRKRPVAGIVAAALLLPVVGGGAFYLALPENRDMPSNQINGSIDAGDTADIADAEPIDTVTTVQLTEAPVVAAGDIANKSATTTIGNNESDEPKAESEASLKDARAPFEALERIPDLDITGHTFSSVPAKRAVTMNGRAWKEGEQVVEGVLLKEITRDGILLDVSGWPVVIGRTRGWKAIR